MIADFFALIDIDNSGTIEVAFWLRRLGMRPAG
jgi:hypothetical protein